MKKRSFAILSFAVIMIIAAPDGHALANDASADMPAGAFLAQFFPNDPTPFKRFRYRTLPQRNKQNRDPAEVRYQLLVDDLQRIQSIKAYDALLHVQNLDVLLYWQVGARLSEEDSAVFTKDFMSRLSQDINLDRDLLYTTIQFYQLYKNLEELTIDLSWKHYVQLIRVKSDDRRMRLQKEAVGQKWTADDLETRINQE